MSSKAKHTKYHLTFELENRTLSKDIWVKDGPYPRKYERFCNAKADPSKRSPPKLLVEILPWPSEDSGRTKIRFGIKKNGEYVHLKEGSVVVKQVSIDLRYGAYEVPVDRTGKVKVTITNKGTEDCSCERTNYASDNIFW